MNELTELEKELVSCDEAIQKSSEILNHYNVENTQNNFQDSITELRTDLDDQLRKIRKKDFEIAVVGREKSGKSSLLNAWIGFNLLPNERNRCTYTTTEIRSCPDINEQKYIIEYFTTEEFEDKLNINDNNSAVIDQLRQAEMKEIEECAEEIATYLDKSPDMRLFQNFDQVRNELKSAISKPGHARAVKKICIWTPKLSEKENIVLYDVPGYDSPITLHKEQTKARIAAVDAILYAKQFCSPDLVDCEIEILKISDANNQFIKAKDKIIVALTNCDSANSPREYDELVAKNKKAWKVHSMLDSRILPICSLAEANSDRSPEIETVIKKLKYLNGGNSGFKQLKEAVNECIINAKVVIARDRCNEIKNKIKDLCKRLQENIKEKYHIDANAEIKDSLDDDEMQKIYLEWWTQQWKFIHEDFQTFFNTKIRPRFSVDENSHLNKDDLDFKKLYDNVVETTFKELAATKKARQESIYTVVIHDGVVSPKEGNTKIRIELSNGAINNLDHITVKLNVFLWQNIDRMIAWIRKRLWNLPEIREEIISKDEKQESNLMKRSFDSLIQRLARPATDIFLRFPRSRVERIRVMQEFQMELLVLDKFMIDGRMTERGILQFLANGKHGKFTMDVKQNHVYVSTPDKNTNDEKQEEINNDIPQTNTNTNTILNKDSKTKASTESLDSVGLATTKPKNKSLFDKIKNKNTKTGEKNEKKVNNNNNEMLKDSNDSTSQNRPNETVNGSKLEVKQQVSSFKSDQYKSKPIKSNETQFNTLAFSPDAELFEEIQNEVETDTNEFLECMKNSVFYGSGIQRYYNQELDRIRRKFIELESEKGRWSYYIFKYLREKDSKVHIPAPNMDDEIKNRTKMIKNIKDINTIIDKFSF